MELNEAHLWEPLKKQDKICSEIRHIEDKISFSKKNEVCLTASVEDMKNTALVQRFDLRKRPQRPMTNEVAEKKFGGDIMGKFNE